MNPGLRRLSLVQFQKPRSLAAWSGIAAWVALVGSGFAVLAEYASTPGEVGSVPTSRPVAASTVGPEVLLFAHPRCPCTRASLLELIRLVRENDATATVVFWQPATEAENLPEWRQSETIRLAEGEPKICVRFDAGGSLTKQYGVVTSGHCLAYDRHGDLRFSGGLTPGRGHEGLTTSQQQLAKLLSGNVTNSQVSFPVFGCRIAPASSGSDAKL
jgi:hypothetical protein